jgi:hypothetical protein
VSLPSGGTAEPSEAREQLAREMQLARDMLDVHGAAAAGVARDNALAAARAGQFIEGRKWLRLVELIQRRTRQGSAGAAVSADAT